MIDCPLIHYVPNKYNVISNYLSSMPQPRNPEFLRKAYRCHSKLQQKIIQNKAVNFIKTTSLIESDSETSEESDSFPEEFDSFRERSKTNSKFQQRSTLLKSNRDSEYIQLTKNQKISQPLIYRFSENEPHELKESTTTVKKVEMSPINEMNESKIARNKKTVTIDRKRQKTIVILR